jgi:hypothetical protein
VEDPGYTAMPLRLLVAWTAAQTSEQYVRHSGTTRTGPYDMNAAFMLLQVHGWDIHAVSIATLGGGRIREKIRAGVRRRSRLGSWACWWCRGCGGCGMMARAARDAGASLG